MTAWYGLLRCFVAHSNLVANVGRKADVVLPGNDVVVASGMDDGSPLLSEEKGLRDEMDETVLDTAVDKVDGIIAQLKFLSD
mmetsp:Transcript_22021/g.38796  ORF Transcript_22021/g.38796 Transcript_22021/m.38796 type:complete len:82 (-) Transcript_22021:226-471(-)